MKSRLSYIFLLLAGIVLTGCVDGVPDRFSWPVMDYTFSNAAVAADHEAASLAGVEMLRKGGNAVDAAVATSFTLSVVRPESCGIGGGGFMVIHAPAPRSLDSEKSTTKQVAISYREQCPDNVDSQHYVKLGDPEASRFGYHASGIPGTVKGLLYALENYGTLDRQTVLAPAIRAAEDGFIADKQYVSSRKSSVKQINKRGYHSHWNDGVDTNNLKVGDTVRNPDQAKTLRLIAEHGADAFYKGEIADAIHELMQQNNGTLTRADLAKYTVVESEPVTGKFNFRGRGFEVISMPPPSSGGVALLQILRMLDIRFDDVKYQPANSVNYIHILTEMMKHAFADRAEWLADSAFVDVPIDDLLDEDYLDRNAWSISLTQTMPPEAYGSRMQQPDDAGTSHFSVIDKNGMAVACTETINTGYGSLVVVPGYGFCLNNQMDDFTTIPGKANTYGLTQSDRNLPEPGKRPLSSMSPTIVLKGGQPVLIAGASGGPRIITGTLQVILNCILHDMNAGEALATPRFHHQWMPNVLRIESNWNAGNIPGPGGLKTFGHEVGERESVGNVQVILIEDDGETRTIHAASDPRKGGKPAGY